MQIKIRQLSRKAHLWLALLVFLPVLIIFVSGILLQIKKQSDWIQPPTQSGVFQIPDITFERVLLIAQSVPELQVANWQDINRVDVRPDKGMMKIIANNDWEAQIDSSTGSILQVAFRRSDTIESIHDGSWFAEFTKLWVFLPVAIILFIMWCSGFILMYTTFKSKINKHQARAKRDS